MYIPLWALIPIGLLALWGLLTFVYFALLGFMKSEYRNFPPGNQQKRRKQ